MMGGVALSVLLLVSWGSAQEETTFKPPVKLSSVSGKEKKGQWFISVTGSAQGVPAGAVIEFKLRYSFKTLEVFSLTLDPSKRFTHDFESHVINGVVDKLFLTASIPLAKQSQEVRAKMEADPKAFPPAAAPWMTSFNEKAFATGSKSQLDAVARKNAEYMKTTILKLAELDGLMGQERKKALEKSDYVQGDSLDTTRWQKFVEGKVRDPIREIQKDIVAKKRESAFLPTLRYLDWLKELSSAVAKRSYTRSKSMYRKLGLSYDPADVAPRDIDASARKSDAKALDRLITKICDGMGISLE